MDLGISGRKAIVCASSRGLGRACAFALAQAGCEVVVNGRDCKTLDATAACPEPDILVNNNGGPPFRDFRELTRQNIIDGVVGNMVVAIELIQKVIDPMRAKK